MQHGPYLARGRARLELVHALQDFFVMFGDAALSRLDALDLAEEVPAAHALGRVVGAEVRRVDRARLGRHDDGRRERGRSRRARSNE